MRPVIIPFLNRPMEKRTGYYTTLTLLPTWDAEDRVHPEHKNLRGTKTEHLISENR